MRLASNQLPSDPQQKKRPSGPFFWSLSLFLALSFGNAAKRSSRYSLGAFRAGRFASPLPEAPLPPSFSSPESLFASALSNEPVICQLSMARSLTAAPNRASICSGLALPGNDCPPRDQPSAWWASAKVKILFSLLMGSSKKARLFIKIMLFCKGLIALNAEFSDN